MDGTRRDRRDPDRPPADRRPLSRGTSRPVAPQTGWHRYSLEGSGGPGQVALLVRRGLRSPGLRSRRDLLVALPPGWEDTDRAYPVVYMQDGQNLFDPKTSANGDWGMIETLSVTASTGAPCIVVGIPNIGSRRPYEYSPFRDATHGGGGGDRYLDFLVTTIKPLVDAAFPTLRVPRHTLIAGSSLGGVISLYAPHRYPEVFGGGAGLSPALWFAGRALLPYIAERAHLPVGRLYMDAGTGEGGDVAGDVERLHGLLLEAGRVEGRDLSCVIDEGAGHDETAWGRRFRAALPFLLG